VVIEELFGVRAGGRHALDEDAVQTPIFAALTRGGWRRRQQESGSGAAVASVEDFRRDPLTAPIPIVPPAAVTGGVLVDMAAGEGRRRARAARERSAAPRDWTAAPREWAAASRDWAGLDALADTGRHHLRVAANW
jgi:hypothetical protein